MFEKFKTEIENIINKVCKHHAQKWYGVKCYDSESCTNYFMLDGSGYYYCYPVKLFAQKHADNLNKWNNPKLKYVAEEVK